MADEAFARTMIDQLLKDADRAFADGCGVRFGRPPDGNGNAGDVLYGSRGSALTALVAKHRSVRMGVEVTQRNSARRRIG